MSLALLLSGCSKEEKETAPAEAPAAQVPGNTAAAAAPANPHAANPHAANPHASGDGGPGMAAVPPAPAAKTTEDGKRILGSIAVAAPEGWTEEPVSSSMRRAQWKVEGEDGPAELVVYYFGQAGAGSVENNLARWYGQFEQADGRATKDVAKSEEKTIADMKVIHVDVSGRYVAAVMPGVAQKHDMPDARMLAAIVDAPDGAYYFKMVGPAKTMAKASEGFDAMLASMVKPAS
ncbi:hypothetical protein [Haliangium ochraceum]|uniref:Lipoprotein n=1 Tax=Haliangium ochraceum (strain DSM 14365 / JCM 11303 / SMP-2) TaxID=502025 RepID=D0LXF1_HALO1|nr:hypothetical protein [Haliangium ochraceum]ACY17706.1 conserved hypothetical protein [Haliangium ochraceum DSM 14365]